MRFTRKAKEKSRPTVSTASLPDIVFMLLFFFMVVTVLRDARLLLQVRLPTASESQKIEQRSLVNYLYIGVPLEKNRGTLPRVQINDAFVSVPEVGKAMKTLVLQKPPALQPFVITSMKVDREVDMGLVSDVKLALRKAEQYKIQYAGIPK